jgi:hypothetical protein
VHAVALLCACRPTWKVLLETLLLLLLLLEADLTALLLF